MNGQNEQAAPSKEECNLYDFSIERAILSCIMKEPTLLYEAESSLKPDDFFNVKNSKLYSIMLWYCKYCSKNGINDPSYDMVSLISAAKKIGKEASFLTEVGGYEHLQLISICPAESQSFRQYISQLLDVGMRVRTYRAGRDIQVMATEGSSLTGHELIAGVEKDVFSLGSRRSEGDIVSLGSIADSFIKSCEDLKDGGMHGVNVTFLPKLMKVLNGFRRKHLVVCFARSKTGKSAFFLNIAIDVAMQGIPVLYIDTEMSQEEQLSRTLSKWSGIKEWDILNGKFSKDPNQTSSMTSTVNSLKKSPLYYSCVRGASHQEVVSKCKQFKTQFVGEEVIGGKTVTKPCLIIYDWIKVGDSKSSNTREYQELGYLATSLKDVCATLDVPLLAGAQANRSGTGKTIDATSVHDAQAFLADSDRILRFCNALLWLRRLSKEEQDEIDERTSEDRNIYYNQMIHVIDQRNGPTCMEGIPLNYECEKIIYREMDVIENVSTNKFRGSVRREAQKNIADNKREAEGNSGDPSKW